MKSLNNLKTIRDQIVAQEEAFYYFIKSFILDNESWEVLNILASKEKVYVLSGIIRDFLTGDFAGARDFDCVLVDGNIKNIEVIKFLKKTEHRVNSFGGIKIKHHQEIIDIWRLADTWGIKKQKLANSPLSLLDTFFFNFSAIVYDFNNRKFIFDDRFCLFLKTKTMDVVYTENPNIPLCLVNILYYHLKYGYHVSMGLARWIQQNYSKELKFEKVQKKHFGQILYGDDYIEDFFSSNFK